MLLKLAKTEQVAKKNSQTGAHQLLKRAPNNYIFNQIYGLWFYISSFLLIALITRGVGPRQYGAYAVIQTAFNTITYLAAFGLEDALITFVPRALAEYGEGAAAQLTRYLLALRTIILLFCVVLILFGLPALATIIALIPIAGAKGIASGLQDPVLLSHSIPIALYVLGTGIVNLFSALCSAQMRTHIVLIINGVSQLALLAFGFVLLKLGLGIQGILWMQAAVSLLGALAFVIWQGRFLWQTTPAKPPRRAIFRLWFPWKKTPAYKTPRRAILQLGFAAWISNLASGALLKQISIALLSIYAVSLVNIGYFNLSFQLADSANTLLVAGFAGVGGSALAAAFVGDNTPRLARTWQALIKVETLLAAPGLVFCLFNAQNIAHALYGSKFDGVGPLLAIFIFFNLLVRVIGTTIHQASLYVMQKPKIVVISQWLGIVVIIVGGIILIPTFGAAGALIADGIAKTITGGILLLALIKHFPAQYPRSLLTFTLRFLLALILAALPSIIWHPGDRILLGVSGVIFIVLCAALLFWIKPLSKDDMVMIDEMNPRISKYIRWFAQS